MKQELLQLSHRLYTLSVFRNMLETPVVSGFLKLLRAIEKGSLEEQLSCYGTFSHGLYVEGGSLTEFVKEFVLNDENMYIRHVLNGTSVSSVMEDAVKFELETLNQFAQIKSADIAALIEYDGFLPKWENAPCDLFSLYQQMLNHLPVNGFGIFAKHTAFRIKDGALLPILHQDQQTIQQLYGYQRERNLVLENTRALMEGKPASNVLLYGDAGTGKSSTIKACVNEFAHQGLRLIEFDRSQLHEIPGMIEQLHNNPLKFVFYIDDLSFNQNDDDFSSLKGILEGGVTNRSENIVIYATSNRRHLVKESMEARMGTDLHLNDTLQETMSLSARFGLTITFSKPEKDLYLEIVKSLAEEYSVEMAQGELFQKAEAFAIRANGRSPRTAKQFIQLVSIGLK